MPTPDIAMLNGSLPADVFPPPPPTQAVLIEESESEMEDDETSSESGSIHSPVHPHDDSEDHDSEDQETGEESAAPAEDSLIYTVTTQTSTKDTAMFKLWTFWAPQKHHEVHIWHEGQPLVLSLESLKNIVDDLEGSTKNYGAPSRTTDDDIEQMEIARSKELDDVMVWFFKVAVGFFVFITWAALFRELCISQRR